MIYETVSTQVMRESDAWTIENLVPSKELMLRAGKGIVTEVVTLLNGWKSPVAIVCGKGNNAGDGFVVAMTLKEMGIDSHIFLIFPESFSEDGKYYFDKCVSMGITWEAFTENTDFKGYEFIVDSILGTGIKGNATGIVASAIEAVNKARNEYHAKVVSADINSGLNGDTGLGSPCVESDLTVSIGTYKIGHFKGKSLDVMKSHTNVDIGIVIQGEIIYNEVKD